MNNETSSISLYHYRIFQLKHNWVLIILHYMLLFSNNLHRALCLNSHSLVCEIAILLKVHVVSHVSEGDTTCFNKLFKP